MSKWICADDIGSMETKADQELIDSAPSIDIIRCGECKHRKPSVCVGSIKIYECDITGFRMHDLTNHFCSYGEREGEQTLQMVGKVKVEL
jgi:hypothetical protein